MYKFGRASKEKLATLDPRLQAVLNEAIKYRDFTIICGHRSEAEQNLAYRTGKSKLKFPQSKHNSYPSTAVDVAPYPMDWNDRERFYYLAGFLQGIAKTKGINLRYGGDWDRDGEITDNTFDDLVHLEIV
jgi:hypothetical protein